MKRRVISYIESSIWACRAHEFDVMCRVAYRESENLDSILAAAEAAECESPKNFDSMAARKGERLNGTRLVEVRENGVAVIDVNGVLAKRMNLFDMICDGGTSTEVLLRDFDTALNSPNVSSIVFNIDSPGGEAFGINEMAQAIFDARGKKPMKAYVSGLGCSGAYWIASACDEVIADKSAFLGSIGVVTAWTDDTGFYKALGIRREVVTSTNAPLKRLNIDKDEHRQELQRELDSLEAVFIKAVARNRKVSVEQVKTDFNRGGVLAGADAVKAKMADRVGSLEQVIRELARNGKKGASPGADFEGDLKMGLKDEFRAFAAKLGFDVTEKTPETKESENPPALESGTKPSAETEKLLAEKQAADKRAAELEKQLETARKEKLETDAETFIETEIRASRMLPTEKADFKSLYLQAAADDKANPLAEGSRLEQLKAVQQKRTPHKLTEELLDPKKGLQNLQADDNPTAKLERAAEEQAANYVGTITPNKPKLEAVK